MSFNGTETTVTESTAISITTIVQAIVDREDWVSGNSIAFILKHSGPSIGITSSSGGREAEAIDGTAATVLTIIYEYWTARGLKFPDN